MPYHEANPNTRNGARLRSPSPIMAPDFTLFLFFCGFAGFLGDVFSFLGVFRFFLGVFLVFLGCFWFSWGVPGFLGGVPGFLGVFRVFLGCSWFSWECSGFWGGVPGFSGVPECSVMFRCSGVPCSGVPGSTTCLEMEQQARVAQQKFSLEALSMLGNILKDIAKAKE